MIPTRSPDIADVIVTVLMRPSGDRGRRLGAAATCDPARGGLLLLDTGGGNLGAWHRVTSSHGRRTRYIYTPGNILLPGIPLFPLSFVCF